MPTLAERLGGEKRKKCVIEVMTEGYAHTGELQLNEQEGFYELALEITKGHFYEVSQTGYGRGALTFLNEKNEKVGASFDVALLWHPSTGFVKVDTDLDAHEKSNEPYRRDLKLFEEQERNRLQPGRTQPPDASDLVNGDAAAAQSTSGSATEASQTWAEARAKYL